MNVFLTGATGFLGGELLVNLSKRKEVKKIYCLIRSKLGDGDPLHRVRKIFELHDDFFDNKKIIPISGDLGDTNLATSLISNPDLKGVNVIIHSAANTSFSRIYNDLIEKVNILGLNEILQWSKTLKKLNTFLYVGTATICGKEIKNRVVKEEESPNENAKHLVKYTYTKMLGEIAVRKNLPAEKVLIVRPSIIMGDSRPVFPRSPVILWMVATCNLMRLIPVHEDSGLDIIPVDYTANAITALLFAERNYDIYHISGGAQSSTTPEKLSVSFAKYFPDRPEFKFVNKNLLSSMKLWAKKRVDNKSQLAEYSDYLSYWNKTFGDNGKLRILFAGVEPYFEFIELGQIFDNTRLLTELAIAPPPPAHEYIKNSIQYLDKIDVFEAALDP